MRISFNLVTLSSSIGVSIGNGYFDLDILASSRIEFLYNHGLLSLDAYDELKSVCCKANAKQVSIDCDFPIIAPNLTVIARNGNQLCAALFPKPTKEDQKLTHAMVDPYYIYDTCKGTGMFNLVFCIQESCITG